MLVFTARRVRPQRRDADSIFDFDCLRVPRVWRAVHFGRTPALDVPAVVRDIFRYAAQLNRLANHASFGVAVGPAAANPCKPRTSPYHAEIWLAEMVYPASARHAFLYRGGRLMCFTKNFYHG